MYKISEKFLNWASILEDSTRDQVLMTSKMPFVFPHIALMPDAHLGKGCAVGAVIPTVGAIMPAAVGVDIGCGMIAVRTQFMYEDVRTRGFVVHLLREAIEAAIPLSKGNYNTDIRNEGTARRVSTLINGADAVNFNPYTVAPNWDLQLGTLGSGNHFIEVSIDEQDRVWLFLHSGSRGVGNKIAMRHIKIAQGLADKWFIDLPHPDLAYLVESTPEFWAYINQLRWAQKFALLNREEMMDRVMDCFSAWIGTDVQVEQRINCHHNYTEQERHFGKDVWLSRKGAIDASEGVWGLVPGSMGTRSYVVTGKGDRMSLNSSPHGAGRNYSRTAARKKFTHDDLRKAMIGIEYRDTDAFIDEIPQAYKDIDIVMKDADDLVKVEHVLTQILNVKGD